MPTLQFKGKNIIWNHHLSVPYHTLEEVSKLHYKPEKSDGNLIIEGDNLLALKALLPQYAGKIKCIYIDPPYNTGTEGWVYNDNVNSPLIKDWLGKEVGKDDLTRHDKWLCMMVPRLRILRDLLSDEGAIFISIDDNELHNLRRIIDEIFDEENFRNIIVIRRGIKSVQAQFETVDRLNYGIEYVVACTKNDSFRFKRFEIELENGKGGGWNNHWRGTDRPKMRYNLFGIKPESGQWRWGKARSYSAIDNYKTMLKEIGKKEDEISQKEIDNWYLKQLEETGEELDLLRLSSNGKPEHYVSPKETRLASNLWSDLKPNGSAQLKAIFGKKVFDNPKSTDLVKRLICFIEGDSKDTIVLDSFAGSGTTGHAVLDLNSEDAGNRKFILVQMTESTEKEPNKNICKDIARERVKKAIEKYDYNTGFKYLRLSIPIDAESMLSGKLPTFKQFAKYIYYLCTGEYLQDSKKINEKTYFIGTFKKQAIYLVYKRDYEKLTRLALNLKIAEQIRKEKKGNKFIVYAPACFLDEDYLHESNIEFVGIPYNMFIREE
jgi:adenine specific DNA methylase Mod